MEKPKITKGDAASQRAYSKWHYHQNKAEYKARAIISNQEMRDKAKALVASYLENKSCMDCGESDSIVLEFDHRDPKDKKFTLGECGSKTLSLIRVQLEMDKCDIRCANCHRRKTYRERGCTHRGI